LRLWRYFELVDHIEFCHSTLLDVWIDSGRNSAVLANWIFGQLTECSLTNESISAIKKKVKSFEIYITSNLQKCSRNLRTFRIKHSQWLSMSFKIGLDNKEDTDSLQLGRPKLNYDEAGPRLKRKLAADAAMNNKNDSKLLIHAATMAAKESNESDTAFVLKNFSNSECDATEAKRKFGIAEPIPLTINEALEFLVENSISKRLYNEIRQISKQHNMNFSKIVSN